MPCLAAPHAHSAAALRCADSALLRWWVLRPSTTIAASCVVHGRFGAAGRKFAPYSTCVPRATRIDRVAKSFLWRRGLVPEIGNPEHCAPTAVRPAILGRPVEIMRRIHDQAGGGNLAAAVCAKVDKD